MSYDDDDEIVVEQQNDLFYFVKKSPCFGGEVLVFFSRFLK